MQEKNNSLEKIFSRECKFIIGAKRLDDIPEVDLPEFGFIGRSNVGKSSLINRLTNRNSLARTSNTPGSTRQINFFNLDNKLLLVDLPGYGYASVSKTELASWHKLIKKFMIGRKNLKRVFILVDSRHGLKDVDIQHMQLMDDSAMPYQILLTKCDLVSEQHISEIIKNIELLYLKHPALIHQIIFCSAKKNLYIKEIQNEIIALL